MQKSSTFVEHEARHEAGAIGVFGTPIIDEDEDIYGLTDGVGVFKSMFDRMYGRCSNPECRQPATWGWRSSAFCPAHQMSEQSA